MVELKANKVLDALENETNASIMNLTTAKIKKRKNDMLQQLQLSRNTLKLFHKKLKKYRYCNDLKDLQIGFYIRWIPLKAPHNLYLTNGGIICDVRILSSGIFIVCKNNRNRIFQLNFDKSLIFQKMSQQECVILKVLDYLDK